MQQVEFNYSITSVILANDRKTSEFPCKNGAASRITEYQKSQKALSFKVLTNIALFTELDTQMSVAQQYMWTFLVDISSTELSTTSVDTVVYRDCRHNLGNNPNL